MDQIKEILFTVVYGEFAVWHIICAVILLFVLVKILRVVAPKKGEHPYMGARTCGNCGWRGQVSKYSATCPACNQSFGTLD